MKLIIIASLSLLSMVSCQIRNSSSATLTSLETPTLKQGQSVKLDKVESFSKVNCLNNLPVLITIEDTLALATCPYDVVEKPTIADFLKLAAQEKGKIEIVLSHIDQKPVSGQSLILLETLSQEFAMHLEKAAEKIAIATENTSSQKDELLEFVTWGNEVKYQYIIETDDKQKTELSSAIIDTEGASVIQDALIKPDTIITSE